MTALDYSWALAIAYTCAFALWLVFFRFRPGLWGSPEPEDLGWRELAWVAVSLVGVLGVGLLYERGRLLPSVPAIDPLIESANQLLIFSPFLVGLAWRRQSLRSVWIRTDRVPLRLAVGLLLAGVGTLVFTLLHPDADPWPAVVTRVYHPRNIGLSVQVLLEDLVIAGLFLRIAGAIGYRTALILTGVIFAGGHIPAMLADGAAIAAEATQLLRDAGLVMLALSVLRRAGDVWLMWMLHFAMDMMQFHSGASLP